MDRQMLLEKLGLLRDSWPTPPWSYDGRFQAVVGSFAKDLEATARASAVHAFPREWTSATLETAPAPLRAIVERTGGLRAGQRVLGGDETYAEGLFGLWWPWGGGATISLRIGVVGLPPADELPATIRALFGVKG